MAVSENGVYTEMATFSHIFFLEKYDHWFRGALFSNQTQMNESIQMEINRMTINLSFHP